MTVVIVSSVQQIILLDRCLSLYLHAVYKFTDKLVGLPLTLCSDTLLNVFLAIAVDNLANAQELTKVHCSPVLLKISVPYLLWTLKIISYAALLNWFLLFPSFELLQRHTPLTFNFFPNLSPSFALSFLSGSLCRTNRRKRRLPIRRLPCRKPRRWLKSAHCLLPISPLQRELSVSITVALTSHSCFGIHLKNIVRLWAQILGWNICTYLWRISENRSFATVCYTNARLWHVESCQ